MTHQDQGEMAPYVLTLTTCARYSPKSKLSRKAQKRRRAAKRRRTRQTMLERRANVPRIWLTMMWHVGSGLPWDWRIGPSDSSKRGHFQEMLDSAPASSLLTADARIPDPGERMRQLIDRALIDPYKRKNKTSRDYPRKKQEQAAGPPIIRKATRAQVQQAMQVKREQKRGLTV